MIIKYKLEECENITSILGKNIETLVNKSILITGANGLIGSYLIDYLLYLNEKFQYNIKIFAMARSLSKLEKRFGKNIPNLYFIEQDLNEQLHNVQQFDYIIHAASNSHPLAFSKDPVGTMKTNLLGTINLLNSIENKFTKFLYISTGEIYGNNTDKAFVEDDLGIVDTKIARSCYPESKRASETLCISYAQQFGIHVNIARLCYVYGPTITEDNSRADAQFLRNALNQEDIVMKSEGLQKRTYCYVADTVSAILFILLNGKNKEVFNIANPNSIASVRQYAQTLANISGVNLKFELPDNLEKQGYSKTANSILDSSKLIKLGWKAVYDLQDGLNHTYKIKKGY